MRLGLAARLVSCTRPRRERIKGKSHGFIGKTAVFGLLERHGPDGHSRVRAKVVRTNRRNALFPIIRENVVTDAEVFSDTHPAYSTLGDEFAHVGVRQKIVNLINAQYECLKKYESVDGGWGYYDFRVGSQRPATDSTSFMNAAGLVAAYETRQMGVPPPERLVKRAIDSTNRQRKPDFSYLYGEYLKWQPMRGINRPAGSSGRSQACNVAFRLWGDEKITDDVMKEINKDRPAKAGTPTSCRS